jgi:hypothetical protein
VWAYKRPRIKHFHGVLSRNQHPYLLESRYGKVSNHEVIASFANGPKLLSCLEQFNFPVQINILYMRPLPDEHSCKKNGSAKRVMLPLS